MTFELRALDPDVDQASFREAYEWIFQGPRWLQQSEGVVAGINGCYSWEHYLEAAHREREVNLGLFNGSLQAVYTIQDEGGGSFQVHVNAKRDVEIEPMIAGAIQLRNLLFRDGANEVFGYIAECNRPLKRFAEAAGFHFSGVSIFKGVIRKRPVRWMRYCALRTI